MSEKSYERTDGGIPVRIETPTPSEVFDAELAAETIKRTDKLNDASIDLAIRLKQAREFVAWSAHHMKKSWFDWMDESNKAAKDINILRMTFDRETKSIIACAKDVRDFFNSQDYQEAHARMIEALEALERFGDLKKSGTLDAFADFILKVSCK